MRNRLDKRKREIDPKQLRKHSQIVASHSQPMLLVGDRTRTDYGFVISGYKGKYYETLYMQVASNIATPLWKHEKKTRVLRVLAGSGYYYTKTQDEMSSQPLAAGDEVVISPNTSYKLSAGVVKLELSITQDAKYDANLEELEPVSAVAEIANEDLVSLSTSDRLNSYPIRMRRKRSESKAAEQIATARGINITKVAKSKTNEDSFLRTAEQGVNAMPVLDLSEDGAG